MVDKNNRKEDSKSKKTDDEKIDQKEILLSQNEGFGTIAEGYRGENSNKDRSS